KKPRALRDDDQAQRDAADGAHDAAFGSEVTPRAGKTPTPISVSGGAEAGHFMCRLMATAPEERHGLIAGFLLGELQDLLSLASLPDPKTSFLDLGMDSLLAVQFFNRLASDAGSSTTLRNTVIFEYPSVDELARYLSENLKTGVPNAVSSVGYRPVINYGSSSLKKPYTLCCLHDITGQAFGYSNLISPLDDLASVIGIQSPSPMDGQSSFDTYGDMIEAYSHAIKVEVEDGQPLVLLGWSMGGVIAHDLACCLSREGRKLDGLVILDAPSESTEMEQLLHRLMALDDSAAIERARELFLVCRDFEEFIINLADGQLGVDAGGSDRLKHAALLLPGWTNQRRAVDQVSESQLEPLLRMFHRNMLLMSERSGIPNGYFPGPAFLIRALETQDMLSGQTLGWDNYCDRVDVKDVRFSHVSLMGKQAAAAIGRAIGNWLETLKSYEI
ncbi:MAG: thioesterase domain-containing protein, partial [Aestuariivirga sp.]|uniref:thioesterase domain-containing protein n=1 Tax=Aestuariivirga sp. TaxID=2650926 RepID=UPI00301A378E